MLYNKRYIIKGVNMPPKAKFTREQIIQAALRLVREEGMAGVTARALGKRIGASSCPVFTVFKNMEEVLYAVKAQAMQIYSEYIREGLKQEIAFKGVGMQYIIFAIKEPKLFQLLFMSEQPKNTNVDSVLPVIDDNYPAILSSVMNGYSLPQDKAENLYKHLWVYTHGIASLCATHTCAFTAEDISRMITEVFKGLLIQVRGGNKQ